MVLCTTNQLRNCFRQIDPSPSTLNIRRQKSAADTSGQHTRDRDYLPQPSDQSRMGEPQEDAEFWPLSGRPYFYAVLTKTHLAKRFQLGLPAKLCQDLPAATVPAKIVYRGRTWDLLYLGDRAAKKLESHGWAKFAKDNNLVVGDACVFELMDGSTVKFKVQILRHDFPSELLQKAEGFSVSNPITLD